MLNWFRSSELQLLKIRHSSNRKVLIFFLFLHENLCYGYSLEAPHQVLCCSFACIFLLGYFLLLCIDFMMKTLLAVIYVKLV